MKKILGLTCAAVAVSSCCLSADLALTGWYSGVCFSTQKQTEHHAAVCVWCHKPIEHPGIVTSFMRSFFYNKNDVYCAQCFIKVTKQSKHED